LFSAGGRLRRLNRFRQGDSHLHPLPTALVLPLSKLHDFVRGAERSSAAKWNFDRPVDKLRSFTRKSLALLKGQTANATIKK
jgi:hypothetical protein